MRYPEIPYPGWTRESGYPKGKRSGGADGLTDRFHLPAVDFDPDLLPPLEKLTFGGLFVADADWAPGPNGERIFVTLNYAEPTGGGDQSRSEDGVEEPTFDDSGTEVPINSRKHDGSLMFPLYRTCHNYMLAAKAGTELPAGWDEKTTTVLDDEDLRWVKEPDGLPEGWVILKDKTRRIESVIVPSPAIVVTTRFKNYNEAMQKRIRTGKRDTPNRTFGEPGEWLVMSSNVAWDGKRWACVTKYQNAEEWDSSYYAAAP